MSDFKELHLGLYSEEAARILKFASGVYPLNSSTNFAAIIASFPDCLQRDVANELFIDNTKVSSYHWTNAIRLTSFEVGTAILRAFRQAIKLHDFKNKLGNDVEILFNRKAVGFNCLLYSNADNYKDILNSKGYFKVNLADAYILGTVLASPKKKQALYDKYGIDRVDALIGCPADPFTVEKNKMMKEEIEQIEKDRDEKKLKLKEEFIRRENAWMDERRNIWQEFKDKEESEEKERERAIEDEYLKKKNELEKKFAELVA